MRVLLRSGHSLFGETGLTIEDLRDQTAIAYQTAVHSDPLQSITDLVKEAGFATRFVGVANTLEELRRMVVSGVGSNVLSQWKPVAELISWGGAL